ncbi:MAG: hypothetical protein GXW94_18685 [Serratia liquefaciens]|nr:hypothetical protein [Serratia liquefaciens]
MRLTVNEHTGYFPAPREQDLLRNIATADSLPSIVLKLHPAAESAVRLEPLPHTGGVNWLPLLWQLVVLKSCRHDLKLSLLAPFSAPAWHRLLGVLNIAPGLAAKQPQSLPFLTLTESRVLLTLLGGMHPWQLAARMNRDIRTISSHKKRAMDKAGLRHNGELYALGALLYGTHHTTAQVALPAAEQQVLTALLCNGSVTATAQSLGKSVKTVSGQKHNIMRRLNVPHEVALFAAAEHYNTEPEKNRPNPR